MKDGALLGLVGLGVCFALAGPIGAQAFSPDDTLPVDKNVTVGTLENGLKYYIRANHKPEKRVLLRLVVERGLDPGERRPAGARPLRGAYGLQRHRELPEAGADRLPRIDRHEVRPGGQRLHQSRRDRLYARDAHRFGRRAREGPGHPGGLGCNVSLEDDEIDKERGVVIEEWRQGQGAGRRMLDKELPFLLKGSKYAERMPIGKLHILETFEPETLREFYRTWYRPDLMAVVAVGDFDPARIEALIQRAVRAGAARRGAKPRDIFPVPDHDEILAVVATDTEMTQTTVTIYHRWPIEPQKTVAAYRQSIVEDLYNRMLNADSWN